MKTRFCSALAGLLLCPALAFAEPTDATATSLEALQRQVTEQQRQINALAEQLEQAPASTTGAAATRTTVGGYGELHYNQLSAEDPANDTREVDFHRFVLFVGHSFSNQLRFHSELELEHAIAGDGQVGEVELEQAYLEMDLGSHTVGRAGLFLLPVGILNETHEPPTFYGVERNDVENIIIPATWWAGGLGLSHHNDSGWSFDLAVHEGLAVSPADGRIRSGRQKTAEAKANNLATTARLKFTGIPGLELAGSASYHSDLSQEDADGVNDALLLTAHTVAQAGIFQLRALIAQWNVAGAQAAALGADRQSGWYLEPALRPWDELGFYLRYENLEGVRSQDQFTQMEGGLNYWPHPQVVFKLDYRNRDHALASEAGRDFRGFDLGVGYHF